MTGGYSSSWSGTSLDLARRSQESFTCRFSVAMPRSGGEYIYISRTLHPALGLFACFIISITALSWTGQLQDWWIRWGFAMPFSDTSRASTKRRSPALSVNWRTRSETAISPPRQSDAIRAATMTARATTELVKRLGGEVHALAFLIELVALNGRQQLAGENVHTVLKY